MPDSCSSCGDWMAPADRIRSEEHTSELQSQSNLVCRLLLEKKKQYRVYARLEARLGATALAWSGAALDTRIQANSDVPENLAAAESNTQRLSRIGHLLEVRA